MGAGVTIPVPDQLRTVLSRGALQEYLSAVQLKPIWLSAPTNFIDLALNAPDPALVDVAHIDAYLADLFAPYRRDSDGLLIAIADPTAGAVKRISDRYVEPLRFVKIDRSTLTTHIEKTFRAQLSRDAVFGLADADPQLCARITITRSQALAFAAITSSVVAGFFLQPYLASVALVVALTVGFVANVAFRGLLVWVGAGEAVPKKNLAKVTLLAEETLPFYTILVPLYHEANVLPSLMKALEKLHYPHALLDVKLVVEEDDEETNRAARDLCSAIPFEIVRVPVSNPRTKPKACNYALRFARGEFTVIFDAEDRPEPDQLLKAVASFRNGPPELGCLQACLNFYNAHENWLTRFFTLDYSLWFDFLLPGLDHLRVPLPLGGTSNHFRTDVLRSIHGWDSFNVTEDADLGIRLARLGYRASILNSTTYEEATNRFPNWLRQRSRWIKGYMQTWLVHMRNPAALFRHAGFRGFIAFQLFIGGSFFSALINPILWMATLFFYCFGMRIFGIDIARILAHVSITGLIGGNAAFTYLAMLGPYRRGWHELTPFGIAAPVYWLLISVAAYRAAWQLITRPFHWEKTQHGTSAQVLMGELPCLYKES